jgi:hypothetical protein
MVARAYSAAAHWHAFCVEAGQVQAHLEAGDAID